MKQQLIKLSKVMVIILFIASFFCLSPTALRANKKDKGFPHGCVKSGYKFNYFTLVLTPSATHHPQVIFLVHNVSNRKVALHQSRTSNTPYIMHINNEINANNWAVFATDQKEVKFVCTRKAKNALHDDVIDCSKVLKICEYPSPRFGDNNRGNYWLRTNTTKNGSVRAIVRHGIIPLGP